MAAIKRKIAPSEPEQVKRHGLKKLKTLRLASKEVKNSNSRKREPEPPAPENTDDFEGLSGPEPADQRRPASIGNNVSAKNGLVPHGAKDSPSNGVKARPKILENSTSSKEAHAKQKALAKERRAAKPSADSIQRSKKLWERLRRKSHVPKDERAALVAELYGIITGQVKEFVFKHDSVRVVQCALKYANVEQKKMIARELKGEYRTLAESRYAKFLIGKLLVEGDAEIRDMVIPEFYGHVRRLINHPEASWILDDTYRGVATRAQKEALLREWYGSEFAIFKSANQDDGSSSLSTILERAPEKRKPIMSYLFSLVNQLIQKKLTGFTMLHDAMLQYFLNAKPGTDEANEFLELLKGDEEGDLLKNLAFTKSGARVVCLALAHGTAKDRRNILKVYKEHIDLLAHDPNGHHVLLAALDVVDDTRLLSQTIISDLLSASTTAPVAQHDKIIALASHLTARIPLLYPLAGKAKWLVPAASTPLIDEVLAIRATTSKKDPQTRRAELRAALSNPLLGTAAARAASLAASSFGCQFLTEVLLSADSNSASEAADVGAATAEAKSAALTAVADLAAGDPAAEEHIAQSPFAGKMLKTLVLGGRFDPVAKTIVRPARSPPLGSTFADLLYARIKDYAVEWACGPSAFVVLSLLETGEGFGGREELVGVLRGGRGRVEGAAEGEGDGIGVEEGLGKGLEAGSGKGLEAGSGKGVEVKGKGSAKAKAKGKGVKGSGKVGNVGARMILEKLG